MTRVIVIDTSEDYNMERGAKAEQLSQYREDTLPILAYYDDNKSLVLVSHVFLKHPIQMYAMKSRENIYSCIKEISWSISCRENIFLECSKM